MENIVTLLEGRLAEEGYVFVHIGSAEECVECDLSTVCIGNLEAGRKYRVTGVRDIEHECVIYGLVKVIEVEECEAEACIDAKLSFPGSTFTFYPQECNRILCKNFGYCVPEGLKGGDRCEILSTSGKAECELGKELKLANIKRT